MSRLLTLLLLTILLYFFANQTQIGWLYVAVALLLGVIGVSRWLNRGMLRGVTVQRLLTRPDGAAFDEAGALWEGETLSLVHRFQLTGRHTALQLQISTQNPAVDPASPPASTQLFIPMLSQTQPKVDIKQEIVLYKRGLYRFPPPQATSRAPFGLFSTSATLAPDPQTDELQLLVYPELRPLASWSLLDRRPAAQRPVNRAGMGQEVLSVRPYRPGDSLRHIHWRSVARTGQLVSREFADERLPGLTIVLDHRPLCAPIATQSKFTPFETAVKLTATLADYALRQRYPLYLATQSGPRGAITAEQLWPFLARIETDANRPLKEQTAAIATDAVAVVLSIVDPPALALLEQLRQRQFQLQVILLDGPTFPEHETIHSPRLAVTYCQRWEIPLALIGYDDPWPAILEAL